MSEIKKINLSSLQAFKGTINMDNGKKSNEQLSVIALENIKSRAEREIPEYGDFAPVVEKFSNTDKNLYAGDIKLVIHKFNKEVEEDPTMRYLKLIVNTPSDNSQNSFLLAYGNKKDLLKSLNDKALVEKIQQKIPEMADGLESDKFA